MPVDQFTRSMPFTLERSEGNDGLTLSGYAAVFNSPTRIRGEQPSVFDEVIAPGAFAKSIRERKPVLMFDHGKNPYLGPYPIGNINTIREDARGLFVEARLHDNWLVQPVRDAIASGAVDGMSFRFSVNKDRETWDRSGAVPLRTLQEVNCAELGPVVFPAYMDTSVAVRSMLGALEGLDVEAFRDATDPDAPQVSGIVDQIEALVAQLVILEAHELAAGGDATSALSMLLMVLSDLDCFEMCDGIEDGPMAEYVNSMSPLGTSRSAALRTLFATQPVPESLMRSVPNQQERKQFALHILGVSK
jgi:HK97 family phage prohead protease